MSNRFCRSGAATFLVICSLGASGAYAQAQTGSSASPAEKAGLRVGHVDHSRVMDDLLGAAQKFREAIQQLAQHEPGPKRDAAVEASRDALLLTQRAMLQLPPELRVEDVKVRDAKDWPKAMARLDTAAQKLRASIEAMSKQPAGKPRDDAVATVNKALAETQQAMLAIPEYNIKN